MRVVIRALVGVAIAVAGGALLLLPRVTTHVVVQPPIVVTMPAPNIPAPQVVVELPAPPAPPAEPAAPALEPPVIGTKCVADPSTLGVPLGDPDAGERSIRGTAIDPDGCAIAAWTSSELFASWDGGQTFARLAVNGQIDGVAVSADRIAVVRDHEALGVVRAGGSKLAWHDLSALAIGNKELELMISAAGPWIAIASYANPVIGATDDDGATWRFVKPPRAETMRVSADGRLWTTHTLSTAPEDAVDIDPHSYVKHHYMTDLRSGRTLADAAIPRDPSAPAWTYSEELDRFWGCGSSQKIVAYHHGKVAGEIASGLRHDVYPTDIVGNRTAAFTVYGQKLYRLRGVRSTDLGDVPFGMDGHVIGVDQYGTVIAFDSHDVLRWSEHGGWRRLLSVPSASSASSVP